jgi:hypothetical protein
MNERSPRLDDDRNLIVVAITEPVEKHGWLRRTNLWRERTSLRTGSNLLKRYVPEGDLGEAKNKHLLPPPQSEELMELKLDDATEFVAALTGEHHD